MMLKHDAYRLPTGELVFCSERIFSWKGAARWLICSEGFGFMTALVFTLSAVVLVGAG